MKPFNLVLKLSLARASRRTRKPRRLCEALEAGNDPRLIACIYIDGRWL